MKNSVIGFRLRLYLYTYIIFRSTKQIFENLQKEKKTKMDRLYNIITGLQYYYNINYIYFRRYKLLNNINYNINMLIETNIIIIVFSVL